MAKKYRQPFVAVEPRIQNRGPTKYVEQLEKRRQALLRAVPFILATDTLDGLQSRIPNRAEYRAYRDSLKVAEIKGLRKKNFGGFAVYADAKARRVAEVDRGRTVIYIRAKETRMDTPPEDVKILE